MTRHSGSCTVPLLLLALPLLLLVSVVSLCRAQPIQVALQVGSDIDASHMMSVTHEQLAAEAEAADAATVSSSFESFVVDGFEPSQARQAVLAYAQWANRTLADHNACKHAQVLVWSAAAVRTHTQGRTASPHFLLSLNSYSRFFSLLLRCRRAGVTV